jgi:hypothetical protein
LNILLNSLKKFLKRIKKIKRKKIRNIHIIGAIFSILLGTLLHFTFAWSGYWKPMALISAVNESTWEHMKMAFWVTLIFALIEFFIYGKKIKNFIFAKTVSLYVITVLISVIFWSYTRIIKDALIWDILDFVLSIIIGYLISYYIVVSKKYYRIWKILSIIFFIAILSAFCLLSYFPVFKYPLFREPINGGFGIIN